MGADREKDVRSPFGHLDKLLIVVGSRSLILVSIAFILIAFAGAWLYMGRIAYFVQGSGVLLSKEGIKTVYADIEGSVREIKVKTGDVIKKGQVYGILNKPTFLKELQNAEEKLQQQILIKRTNDKVREEKKEHIRGQIANLKEKIQSQRKLLAAEVIVQETLLSTIQSLKNQEQELINFNQEEKQEQIEVDNLRREFDKLKIDYENLTTLKSPYEGTVSELMFDSGSVLTQGMPTMVIELSSEHLLNAILYIPFEQAKKVKQGMPVSIVPSFIKLQEYGGIKAIVDYVDTYPASEQAMFNEVQNKTFIESLLKQGVQVKVTATLLRDKDTVSSYAWTTSTGAPIQLQSGTFCQAKIRIEEKRPIDLIIYSRF